MILALALLLAAGSDPAAIPAPTPAEQLRDAHSTFDFANYERAAALAEQLLREGTLTRTQDQIEANRILGLSRYYLKQYEPARKAFLDLLLLDPDYQLDAFYVPPDAITFFEAIRESNKEVLEPIRVRRRADAQRAAEEARRLPPPTVVVQLERPKNVFVALLPGGAGQFQNGDTQLGYALLISESALVAIALGCQIPIMTLQDLPHGQYSESNGQTARTYQVVQVTAGSIAALLWVLGATEAVLRMNSGSDRRVETTDTPPPHASLAPHVGIALETRRGGAGATAQLSLSF